ncbi:hypothetical protein JW968_01980 [Candidatus Woesearchaeota archaeon]|nr:hypothetical protein [Candidatus Woesearchaeota archaeon]
MEKDQIFWWLVAYHADVNLPKVLPHMDRGGFVHPLGKKIKVGKYENDIYHGFLIVANGDTLAQKIQKSPDSLDSKVIHDSAPPQFVPIQDIAAFMNYLDDESADEPDGAYVINSMKNSIAHVGEYNNNISSPDFARVLPHDFIHCLGDIPVNERTLGTKTKMAIKASYNYDNTEAFQIKRTAFNGTGMGKVTHFRKGVLYQEFYFAHEPDVSPLLVPEQGIIGVHREYDIGSGSPRIRQSLPISFDDINYKAYGINDNEPLIQLAGSQAACAR